jgi:hypothetical protein
MDKVPIEKDPRFLRIYNKYLLKVEKQRLLNYQRFGVMLSLLIGPMHTIAASM